MLHQTENPTVAAANTLACVAPAGPEVPRPFSPEDEVALRKLQSQHGTVTRLERNAVAKRALLIRAQHRFTDKYGVASINAYADAHGFENTATSLLYHLAAQLLLNINMQNVADDQRDACQYEVSQLARALDELAARRAEHSGFSDDEFVQWYRDQKRISGLADSYLARKRANKSARAAGNAVTQVPAIKTPDEQVAEMFDNPAALEIDAFAGISSGQEGVLLYRQEGDKVRVIPLTASKATIIGLAGYAPGPLTAMPTDLRVFREMLMAGEAFVPDQISDVPVEAVPEGDLPNTSYDMRPANGMYLVERDRFSIAHARRDDGLIVEVNPAIDLGFSLKGECFIDNLTRRRLGKRLLGEADAVQFGLQPIEGSAARVTVEGKTKTVTFTNAADGTTVNLIVKPRQMGSVWTYRVSSKFAPAASATMSPAVVSAFDATFMKVLLKRQKDRPVAITVDPDGISFANDKAPAVPFEASTLGDAKVRVMLEDLRRAMVGLLALPASGGLTWRLDPAGLLLIEAVTELATYSVFVQTLEPSRQQPTRSRALRERVESLPKTEASAAGASVPA